MGEMATRPLPRMRNGSVILAGKAKSKGVCEISSNRRAHCETTNKFSG